MDKGTPDPGDHHRVSGPLLHLRDEAAAGLLLPQEGRRSLQSGSKTPGRGAKVGEVTAEQIREIAEKKMADLNCDSIESAARMIEGSARSMGLEVVG